MMLCKCNNIFWCNGTHLGTLPIRRIKQNKMATQFNKIVKDFNYIRGLFMAVKFETVQENNFLEHKF